MDYEEIEQYIENIPRFTKKNSLSHTAAFLAQLGNPQNKMKVIHVAGTNGKGSVCAFIASILNKCNKKTGLFTSPHLMELTERININGRNVTKEEFIQGFMAIKSLAGDMEIKGYPHPSYFEFLFLMAIYIFDRKRVEYVVLETGLGGRLDATNVIENPEVTVVTSIGYDHMDILGDTIEEIAVEKAGIIKENVPVVYQGENPLVNEVIEKRAEEMHARSLACCHLDYKIVKKSANHIDFYLRCGYYLNNVFSVPFIAEYQVENAVLALMAVAQLQGIGNEIENVKSGLADVRWQGRMEQVMPGVYFDGAHNGPGIDAFVKTVSEYSCSGNKYILFSAVKEKDYKYMVEKICLSIRPKKIFVTQIGGKRNLAAGKIAGEIDGIDSIDSYVSDSVQDAFFKALDEKKPEDVLFCVGSLYLIGELKELCDDGGLV